MKTYIKLPIRPDWPLNQSSNHWFVLEQDGLAQAIGSVNLMAWAILILGAQYAPNRCPYWNWLTDSSRGLAQKIREIFAKNTRKICEIFVKNTRKIYEKFVKKSQKNRKKSKFAKNLWKNREKSANFDFLRFFCDFFANFS